MFSFFRKKPAAPAPTAAPVAPPAALPASAPPAAQAAPTPAPAPASWWRSAVDRVTGRVEPADAAGAAGPDADDLAELAREESAEAPPAAALAPAQASTAASAPAPVAPTIPTPAPPPSTQPAAPTVESTHPRDPGHPPQPQPQPQPKPAPDRSGWVTRLSAGLKRTGSSIGQVFAGAKIDDALYEQLEDALLMADAGPKATAHLLAQLRARVKAAGTTDPAAVRGLLAQVLTELLATLEGHFEVGRYLPTVAMVVGVNGAGKTTTIGKLTRHLAEAYQRVLLVAGDTFRAAAREQLAGWVDRNSERIEASGMGLVDIVSQQGGDPAAVSFDAVQASKARRMDVVIVDTAGRLATQLHLMDELRKIKRVIAKADGGAPHEVLLVVDGNTGQNALAQVKAFDEALDLTGLVVTKLDGTAKGGVLAAIALWSRERQAAAPGKRPVAVYYLGVGERLEDLQTFDAAEFAQALLG